MSTCRSVLCVGLTVLILIASVRGDAIGQRESMVAVVAAADPFAHVSAIGDSENRGWPRTVFGLNGQVTIREKPQRIVTLSVGHDEVSFGLVPAERIVAVGRYTRQPFQSNVATLARDHAVIGREPESVVASRPDLVVASRFTSPELVAAIGRTGITVLQVDFPNTIRGRLDDILLLGYAFGEEARAVALASEVAVRYEQLRTLVAQNAASAPPRVASLTSYGSNIFTAGILSTEGLIIEAAGAINVAAEAGLSGNPPISLEGIVALAPDVIIIPQPRDGADRFRDELLRHEAIAYVPAIRQRRVYPVAPNYFTTLSFWNVRGAEVLAALVWPALENRTWPPFHFPLPEAK